MPKWVFAPGCRNGSALLIRNTPADRTATGPRRNGESLRASLKALASTRQAVENVMVTNEAMGTPARMTETVRGFLVSLFEVGLFAADEGGAITLKPSSTH